MKKKRRTIELAPQTAEMFARCVAVLKPPPELTLSQWADTYRMLSAENSATPGRWHTDNAPYQREIMDAIGDQHVRKVVVMSAAQIGKTAMLMNTSRRGLTTWRTTGRRWPRRWASWRRCSWA